MRTLALAGLSLAAVAWAAPAALAEDPIKWIENWEDASTAAKEKHSVVFVYVHRTNPP